MAETDPDDRNAKIWSVYEDFEGKRTIAREGEVLPGPPSHVFGPATYAECEVYLGRRAP